MRMASLMTGVLVIFLLLIPPDSVMGQTSTIDLSGVWDVEARPLSGPAVCAVYPATWYLLQSGTALSGSFIPTATLAEHALLSQRVTGA